MSIEARKDRKPLPTIYLLLLGFLRIQYLFFKQFFESIQHIGLFFHTLKSTIRDGYSKGLLSRERVGLNFVVWGSGREFHGWDF